MSKSRMSHGCALGLGMHLFRAAVRDCEKVVGGRGLPPVGGKSCEKSSTWHSKVYIPLPHVPMGEPLERPRGGKRSENATLLSELPLQKPCRRSRLRRTGRRSLGGGRRGSHRQYGSRVSPVKANLRVVEEDRRCSKALSFGRGCGLHDYRRESHKLGSKLVPIDGSFGARCPKRTVLDHRLPVDANRHTKRRWWFAHHVSKYMPRLVKDRNDPRRLRSSLVFCRKFRKGAWLEYKSRFRLLDKFDELIHKPDRLGRMKAILVRKPVRYEKRKQSRSGALTFTSYRSLVARSPKRAEGSLPTLPGSLVIDPKAIAALWSPFDLRPLQLSWVARYFHGGSRVTTLLRGKE